MAQVSAPAGRKAGRRALRSGVALLSLCALLAAVGFVEPATAQIVTFPARPKPPVRSGPNNEQMLVQADEIQYNHPDNLVSAVGNVQIYYKGSTLEADKVTYDQAAKRLHAEGNARLTDANGEVTYGQTMELSDDYRDGFVDSLRVDGADQTSIAAARAKRSGGNFTQFQSGVYTACEPCKEHPEKPPLWQVKAARIIHDQKEKMLYFEDARFEFYGMPIAYFPYFSNPDPTVSRKSGFLTPTIGSSTALGAYVSAPYFWALAPNSDVTFSPLITTTQGPLLRGEYRQRFESGSFYIRASGIDQLNPDKFVHSDGTPTPGFRRFRGGVDSAGQFALSDKFIWGWNTTLPTDKSFFQNYDAVALSQNPGDLLRTSPTEGVSQLYLTGVGKRSFFDVRSIYFYGFSEADIQGQIPIVHPVLDYDYTLDHPVLGGELNFKANTTSLSRDTAEFDAITANAFGTGTCAQTADVALNARKTSTNCLLRGVPGDYNRVSAQATWRKSITDPYGEIFTPFASLRASAATASVSNQPGVSNYITPGQDQDFQVMPTVGLEYRYPFLAVHSWGTETLEPIAQIIARPNENRNSILPNEDSQSLIFDDSNLFKIDKFAGWDRTEGGGRANVGVQYTAQFNKAGYFNAVFGQSYKLFGENSFSNGDLTNTGLDSGLDKSASDYVARATYAPNQTYSLTASTRLDERTLANERLELEGRAAFDRFSTSVLYGHYAAQPDLGFLTSRDGVLASGTYKLTQNWNLSGAISYDIDAHQIATTQFGIGYIDDCVILALRYATSYIYNGNPQDNSHIISLSLTLRTLGGPTLNQRVGGIPGGF